MKKYLYILVFSSLLSNFHLQSQENNIISESAYAEKIYVQLSSTIFTSDTSIWFKAIVTDLMHLPTRLSGVLHVELVDFDKRIVAKKLLKIEKGMATGFFDLKEKMPAGRYQIRAYTEWNKNFGTAFISETYIDIYAPKKVLASEEALREVTLTEIAPDQFEIAAQAFPKLLNPKYKGSLKIYVHTENKTDSVQVDKGKDEAYSFQYKLPQDAVKARIEIKVDSVKLRNANSAFVNSYSKTIAINKHYIDLQFFPEGGKLVDGLTSNVAFKALDYKNQGISVAGHIVDEANAIVMPFQSNELGMGITYLTPNIQKKYYARIKGKKGLVYKYELPLVQATGVVLQVKERKEYLVVSLKNKNYKSDSLLVKVQARGLEQDQFFMKFKKGVAFTAIEKSVLPEGLVKISISNMEDQIVCERLFFNYKEEERIEISSTPNLKQYSQRGKTTIQLATKNSKKQAVKSHLSVLVINKEQLGKANEKRSNLVSYFLLNSELQGTIEKPSTYFNPKNKRRKQMMDALLLTQGWSNYKYEKSAAKGNFKFLPEKNLSVSGRLRNLISQKKPLKNPIDLTLIYGPLNVLMQKVDTSGRFRFYLEDYYKDEFKVLLQSKSEKGKKKDFTIYLDSYKFPKVSYQKEIHIEDPEVVTSYIKQNIARKKAVENFNASKGTIALDEVELTGYRLTEARTKMMKRYGPPDVVVENKELLSKVEKWHSGLYSLLQSSYPNDVEIYPVYPKEGGDYLKARVFGAKRTIVLIDGIPVKRFQYPFLDALPIEEIKSFELIKRPKRTGSYLGKSLSMGYDLNEDSLVEGAGYGQDETGTENEFETLEEAVVEEQEPVLDAAAIIDRTSVICIYTYAGKGFNFIKRPKGMYSGIVPGFAAKREFYAPKYEDPVDSDWNVQDVRSVIHWAPNIVTDAEGNTKIEFYNGDTLGEMLVIIEAITENGKLGYAETTYVVEKKDE
ncbi:hypothetical protein [Flavicella sediminum]|uniref:hypothetical protein n=1 Tax=Flavicella sediminum TaxID=2585141 RepID=UPI00112251AC|nr:hypothetical protein [Flavicella sediminum]